MSIKHEILWKDGGKKVVDLTPIRAIRQKCLNCCCWSPSSVKGCPAKDCPLWPFRFGTVPGRKRELTEEQRKIIRERLRKSSHSKKTIS